MTGAKIYDLKDVDYSERGKDLEIIVDGIPKPQTVIFSGTDCFGEKYYFTEQGLRYIQDSRDRRPQQNFVLNYVEKIPIILKSPTLLARHRNYPDRYLFCNSFAIKNLRYRKSLLGVVLIKSNINSVWNFYWLEENKAPKSYEII